MKYKQENNNIQWFCNKCVRIVETKLSKVREDVSVKTQEILNRNDKKIV